MDSFMDRIAQKLGGQDVIRANAEAEARELENAKSQISEYEKILSEMRRLNLKCVETNEQTSQMVQASLERLDNYKDGGENKDYSETIDAIKAALETANTDTEQRIKDQEEFIHKENVRVYRNVQASIIDELTLQTEAISTQNKALEKRMKAVKPIVIVSLALNAITLLGVAYTILQSMGLF